VKAWYSTGTLAAGLAMQLCSLCFSAHMPRIVHVKSGGLPVVDYAVKADDCIPFRREIVRLRLYSTPGQIACSMIEKVPRCSL
jgi:hypothetical protein